MIDRFDTYAEVSPSGRGVKLFFSVAAKDREAIDGLLDGKTRKAFVADERQHREIAIDRDRYYAITEDRLYDDTPETFRVVPVKDVRWFIERVGPRYLQKYKPTEQAPPQPSMTERPPRSLQESVLTTLAFDESYGAKVANQVQADHFEGVYRDIGKELLDYWQRYQRPPGAAHLDDLLASPKLERQRQRVDGVMQAMLAQSKDLNAAYVYTRLDEFLRRQNLKTSILRAAEILHNNAETDASSAEVMQILDEGLRQAQTTTQETRVMPVTELCALTIKPPNL